MSDSNIVSVLARVYVDDLDASLPLYQQLTGAEPHRFSYGPMSLARVGSYILVQGAPDDVRKHGATIAVRDVAVVLEAVKAGGGEALEGPAAGPNGSRMVARHGDGAIFEYIEVG